MSSPDASVTSTFPLLPDDFQQFQELLRRVANELHGLMEEVQDKQHQLLDSLHFLVPSGLLFSNQLEQFDIPWPLTRLPPKGAEKRYYVPGAGQSFFSHTATQFPHGAGSNGTVQTATPALHSDR